MNGGAHGARVNIELPPLPRSKRVLLKILRAVDVRHLSEEDYSIVERVIVRAYYRQRKPSTAKVKGA